MIMKGSITTAICGAIPDSDNAKIYLARIEEQFQGSSKAHVTTLITKMVTLKYSGSNGVCEHILRMNDMASQLKGLDMEISEGFLVHFIMTSLPAQFGCFKINYNTQKEKWKMSELIFMRAQEEERLKYEQHDGATDWNVKENLDACYECGRTGHIKKYCPQLRNKTAGSNSRDFKEKKFKSRKALLTWDDSDESDKEGSEDEDVAQLCFMANDDDPKKFSFLLTIHTFDPTDFTSSTFSISSSLAFDPEDRVITNSGALKILPPEVGFERAGSNGMLAAAPITFTSFVGRWALIESNRGAGLGSAGLGAGSTVGKTTRPKLESPMPSFGANIFFRSSSRPSWGDDGPKGSRGGSSPSKEAGIFNQINYCKGRYKVCWGQEEDNFVLVRSQHGHGQSVALKP
ncbi:hypothetical protein RJ640_001500 [Escallonia rubra]|uniref:CCHC-type domain-containing protein n=1 Tax=Escallonia rubra TaxID=112253 RepID=A0AA88S1C3_9ASTE|nr:hypothetical protein RJ640_001500 [Escallonia rubra]